MILASSQNLFSSRQRAFAILMLLSFCLSSCFFFRKKDTGDATGENTNPVLGKPLGSKAGGPDYAQLEDIYALTTDHEPAGIRPDPDTYIRRLLLQYRQEGPNVAREIGKIEEYRILLGGASTDFRTMPQDQYDATSLLTSIRVAEKICLTLVAPNSSEHPGWKTILKKPASSISSNIKYLAQRFMGVHSNNISQAKLDDLREIFDLSGGSVTYARYIPVCATLAMDAEGIVL